MPGKAFFINDDDVVYIANSCGAGTQYRAQPHLLAPGGRSEPRTLDAADTVIVVEIGTLAVMVNGMVAPIGPGQFARIPAHTWFAYANEGAIPAQFLIRTSPPPAHRDVCRVTLHIAAA